MNIIKSIRDSIGITQAELADALGCTQGNIGHYERGQSIPPEKAKKLVEFAASKNVSVTLEQIYS